MSISALILALGFAQGTTPPAAPARETYTNEWIGISITHPTGWKIVPKKTDAWITVPLKEGTAHAAIYFVAATYNADIEIWQKSQEHANNQLGFEIIKQWQEEILGVPMLLTKVRSGAGKLTSAIKAVPELPSDQPLVTLIGLVYSRTPRKLLFRLTAPEAAFDDAEFIWRQALQTLRTVDGTIPLPEDPKREPDPLPVPGKKPAGPPVKTAIGLTPANGNAGNVKAPKTQDLTVAGRKVVFHFPEGWTAVPGENGLLTLKTATPDVSVTVQVNSILDSAPPMRALVKASGESLKSFEKVETREENVPKANKAGAVTVRIWRTGVGSAGPIWTFEAVGGKEDFYFLIRQQGAGKVDPAVRAAMESLLDQISLEPPA